MRSENAARVILVALLVLTVYLMYRIFQPFLPGIGWALVLTVVLHPLHARTARLLGGRERLAAAALAVVAALLLVVPTFLAIVQVARGLADGYAWVQGKVQSGQSMAAWFPELPWLSRAVGWVEASLDLGQVDIRAMLLSALKSMGAAVASGAGAVVTNTVQMALLVAVMVATLATLLHGGPRLITIVERYLPLAERDRREVLGLLRDTTRAVFFGVILTALIQGILGGIGFAIVGLPNAITFGALMFVTALLPGGTAIVWAPAALWLFATGHPWKGGILLAWGLLAVSSVDNVLRPLFIGRGVQLPMLLVFFGTLGGMLAFGLIGLFTGPLVITMFLFLLEVVRRDYFRPDDAPP